MTNFLSGVWQYIKQPWRLVVPLKRVALFCAVASSAAIIYWWSIGNLGLNTTGVASLLIIWVLTAYLVLPRVHRLLSNIYVPDYFIGRARTVDGLLADPVNLAVRGSRKDLLAAMLAAGWQEADPLNWRTALRIVVSTLRRRSYPSAPVSDLFVFSKRQNLAFQKEVNGNPAKRHHVRFWNLGDNVYLPGGYEVDWVAAATYDDAVGFSWFTLQVTHSIDGDVDGERDYVVRTLRRASQLQRVQHIDRFFPGYTHRNGGGHSYFTDGSMVIIDLNKGVSTK